MPRYDTTDIQKVNEEELDPCLAAEVRYKETAVCGSVPVTVFHTWSIGLSMVRNREGEAHLVYSWRGSDILGEARRISGGATHTAGTEYALHGPARMPTCPLGYLFLLSPAASMALGASYFSRKIVRRTAAPLVHPSLRH